MISEVIEERTEDGMLLVQISLPAVARSFVPPIIAVGLLIVGIYRAPHWTRRTAITFVVIVVGAWACEFGFNFLRNLHGLSSRAALGLVVVIPPTVWAIVTLVRMVLEGAVRETNEPQ